MKKVRKFAQGGSNPNITDDVRERARMFAMMADDPEAQAAFQRSVHRADQAAAEKLPPPSRPAPAQRPTSSSGSGSSGRDRSMGPPTSRPTPQAYSSDDFDPNEAPADAAARLNAQTRDMGVEEPKLTRTLTRVLPVSSFEEENAKRVARNKAEKQEREESEAAAKRSMDNALEEAKTRGTSTPRSKNVSDMGERQARQMEEKGSVFSKDFGKPKAERDAIEAGERSDRREQARQAAEERDRRESERKREIRRAEVEGNVERDEASQGAARRKQEEEAKRKEAERKRAATSKAMQARQEREEEDTGESMRGLRSAEAKLDKKRARPNYPTERRVIDERRKRILGTDRPSMFKREDKKRERDTAPGSVQGASFKSGGMVSSASKRADGIASKGKTRGRIY